VSVHVALGEEEEVISTSLYGHANPSAVKRRRDPAGSRTGAVPILRACNDRARFLLKPLSSPTSASNYTSIMSVPVNMPPPHLTVLSQLDHAIPTWVKVAFLGLLLLNWR
jgi:hypothetical protein